MLNFARTRTGTAQQNYPWSSRHEIIAFPNINKHIEQLHLPATGCCYWQGKLPDVNVLVALIDPAHVQHDAAHDWFAKHGKKAWATCPLTENGVLRIVGHVRYPNSPGTPAAVAQLMAGLCALPGHVLWPDDSLTSVCWTPKNWTHTMHVAAFPPAGVSPKNRATC